MPDATIAIDGLKTFQIALQFPPQIALNFNLIIGDRVDDLVQLLGREFLGPQIWIDVGLLKNAPGNGRSDSINVSERRFDAFLRWNFDS